jgi:hypothetical protein
LPFVGEISFANDGNGITELLLDVSWRAQHEIHDVCFDLAPIIFMNAIGLIVSLDLDQT